MASPSGSTAGAYSLATGEAAVRRLKALQEVYGPSGERILVLPAPVTQAWGRKQLAEDRAFHLPVDR